MKNGLSKRRWPEFHGWDEKAEAIEILAQACGAYVYCSQKHKYLNVEVQRKASTPAQTKALYVLADLIEQLTDCE
ncbi:hypothetical protein [uncultured Tateyamaria sp.]|uniref:hypothetical protein n=1 Tax=uncultured Tateyamaria sp. TaxID=455651 RepID=UPI00262F7F51|nr:hypothetical protein [uncultured Tateyamaria sp.]